MQAATHDSPCQPLQDVQEFINGNGKVGAKVRLALLEQDVLTMKQNINRATGWIIGGMVTLITGVLLWIFTSLIPTALSH
jgi:hypothetical protein